MSTTPTPDPPRRSGAETRSAIQQVALELFTARGYDATSMRAISDALGIRKASLYYHFGSKEEILASLFEQRGDEAEQLLTWIREQRQEPQLVRAAVLRWVDSFSADKLRGIRFLSANALPVRAADAAAGARISSALEALVDALAGLLPRSTAADILQLRMALLSINAAVDASTDAEFSDDDIITAARNHAEALVDALLG